MSRRCQVTGRAPGFGHRVSHSHRRTPRRFGVNVQSKRFWVPSLGRHVRLRVSPKGLKEIDRRGIDAVVARLQREGARL